MNSLHRLLIPALLGALALPALHAAPRAAAAASRRPVATRGPGPVALVDTLKGLVKWAKGSDSNDVHTVVVHAVSNQSNTSCSYGWARLVYDAKSNSLMSGLTGKRFFSDRMWGTGTGLAASFKPNPFDPAQTEKFGVTIDATSGAVKLHLGAANAMLAGKWEKGLVHGFSGKTGWILSFKMAKEAIIK